MKKRHARKKSPPSILAFCGLGLVFLASTVWGMLSAVALLPEVLSAADLENYRPARFVVTEVVYQRSRKGGYSYYAKGQIDGAPEEFGLSAVAPVLPTREALEKHFGQQPVAFAVMYNPNRSRSMVNGSSLRVRPAQAGFVESHQHMAAWAICNVLISVIVAVTAGIFLKKISGVGKKP
jgi:hypothetical protein